MELDDIKNTWDEMSYRVKEKQNVNLKLFDNMSKRKFDRHLNKIIFPEILGSAVCIGSAAFIGFNFYRLDTVTFKVVGILSILLFVVLCVLSLLSIQHLYKGVDVNKPYADTLKTFAIEKIKFCKLQKLNITVSYLLLVTVILLMTRLFGRNEITDSKYFWILSFSIGYIFLVFFSKFVYKSYNKTIRETENLLKEL